MDNNRPIFGGMANSHGEAINTPAQPTSPAVVASGSSAPSKPQDAIILSGASKKRRVWPWVALFATIIIIWGAILIRNILNSNNSSNDQVSDESVYDLMLSSYEDITGIQQLYIDARDGYFSTSGFFSEDTKTYVDSFSTTMKEFYDKVFAISPESIGEDAARENFAKLQQNLSVNISAYTNTVELYDLFYDYVNSNYNSAYSAAILDLNNAGAATALSNLDSAVSETSTWEGSTIVIDIFSAYTDNEEFVSTDYYELMGDLIGQLQPISESSSIEVSDSGENKEDDEE